MFSSLTFYSSFTIILIFCFWHAQAHGQHLDIPTDPAKYMPKVAYGFGLIAIAFIGTLAGASVPLLDTPLKALRNRFPISSRFIADITGPSFTSAVLAFSSGILIFGSLGMLIPECQDLMEPFLDMKTGLVVLALWSAGLLFMFGLSFAVHWLFPSAPSCTCHAPPVDSSSNAAQIHPLQEKVSICEGCGCSLKTEGICECNVESNTAFMENKRIQTFGALTAFALSLHKIPEGIVTFIAALYMTQLGTALAFGMLLHNFPEALAVSVPIYSATESAWKAFCAACAVGCTQFLGAGIGYAIVKYAGFSDLTQAILFAPIAGMMTWIAVTGLWPSAIYFDGKRREKMMENRGNELLASIWVPCFFVFGAFVMFFSSSLMSLGGGG